MSMFVITTALLALMTALNAWVCTRWPHRGRDIALAFVGSAVAAVYLVFNKENEIAVLWTVTKGHGLTVADLFALPAILFSSLLMGRTILLASVRVPDDGQQAASVNGDAAPSNLAAAPAVAAEDEQQVISSAE